MAVHDFRCLACDYRWNDVNIPVSIGARAGAPYCPRCDVPTTMEPIIAIGRMSIFSEFAKFTTPVEDPGSPTGFRDETISTLGDIRRLEKESEQRERDGLGRRMIWRDYSQDQSNKDVHTMGPPPSETPSKTYTNGTPVRIRRGDPVVTDHGRLEEQQVVNE